MSEPADQIVDRYAEVLGVDPQLVEARFNAVLPIARRLAQVISGRFDMRERDIEAYLVKRVKALGGEVRKIRFIGHRGAPDRLVMLPARRVGPKHAIGEHDAPAQSVWFEVKAPGAKPPDYQLREHARLRKMGLVVQVVSTFDEIDRLLG